MSARSSSSGKSQVVDPAPAVARHLPAGVDHRARGGRVALERLAHRVHGQRQAVILEDAVDAPEARAAAELEHRLGVEVAPADRRRRADDLVQVRLGLGVALERRPLAALLVVEHEAERQPRAARPVRVGRVLPVADEVAGHALLRATASISTSIAVGQAGLDARARGIRLGEELAVDAVVTIEVAEIHEERVHLQHVVERAPGRL